MQSEIKKERAKEKAKKLYELVGIEEVGVMVRRNKIPEETPSERYIILNVGKK